MSSRSAAHGSAGGSAPARKSASTWIDPPPSENLQKAAKAAWSVSSSSEVNRSSSSVEAFAGVLSLAPIL